jgi:branched-chain amino acid transport system permease protein
MRTDVGFAMSSEMALTTLLGGMGAIYGPVVGAVVVVSMQNYLAQYGQWAKVTQGGVFVVCVLTFRSGIVGEIANALKWTSL